jgi:hypothetical protein
MLAPQMGVMTAQTAGDRLKASIVGALPPGVELDEREEVMLNAAAAQADAIELLEAHVAEHGVMVPGRVGLRVNPGRSQDGTYGARKAVGDARAARFEDDRAADGQESRSGALGSLVTRLIGGGHTDGLELHPTHLWIGVGGWRSPTVEALRQEWRLCQSWFMSEYPGLPCHRPWGWWDARGEEPPPFDEEPHRLAVLGELSDDELAGLRRPARLSPAPS